MERSVAVLVGHVDQDPALPQQEINGFYTVSTVLWEDYRTAWCKGVKRFSSNWFSKVGSLFSIVLMI